MEISGLKIKKLSYIFSKTIFLYYRKWNFPSLRTFQARTIKKKLALKKFVIFRKMGLSSPKHKKILMFQEGNF